MTVRFETAARRQPVLAALFNQEFIGALLRQDPPLEAILYTRAAEASGINMYFFSVDDVNLEHRTICGINYSGGIWAKKQAPWPDFFYDQCKDMPKSERAKVEMLRRYLPDLTTPINTRRFLDKWQLYLVLKKEPRMRRLLPPTYLCRSPRQLLTVLKLHRAVIAKPTNSSRGRGISLVRQTSNKRFNVLSNKGETHKNLTIRNAYRIIMLTARRDRVVLQKQLRLPSIDGRLFDLRMLMGKNAKGQWIPASPRLRLGANNSFVTNTNQGAERLHLLSGLTAITGEHIAHRIYERAVDLSKQVCHYIEKAFGPMGEIGLDFILDENLRFWFIEGNPQPGKTPLPDEDCATASLYTHVMEYVLFQWDRVGGGD